MSLGPLYVCPSIKAKHYTSRDYHRNNKGGSESHLEACGGKFQKKQFSLKLVFGLLTLNTDEIL